MPEWLNTSEAAAYLGLKIDTLRRMVKGGQVKAHRLPTGPSASYRFRRSDLDAVPVPVEVATDPDPAA